MKETWFYFFIAIGFHFSIEYCSFNVIKKFGIQIFTKNMYFYLIPRMTSNGCLNSEVDCVFLFFKSA